MRHKCSVEKAEDISSDLVSLLIMRSAGSMERITAQSSLSTELSVLLSFDIL